MRRAAQRGTEQNMQTQFVYVTVGDKNEALRIGRILVEERLAACVNVLDGMTSVYSWKGEVHEDSEAVLIAKTKAALVGPLTDRVKELHSYECPCVVSFPIAAGNPEYLAWIEQETR
jgi:periplasmic divalent cation tolerance protein